MAKTNRQVWQNQAGEQGTIKNSELPATLDDRIVLVKVHSWAINPCDAMLQDQALPIVTYPVILGQDVSGTVEAVGKIAAEKFKPGDHVFCLTINNGFQEYAFVDHLLAAKIPDNLSFNDTAVFGLCANTAAFSLFGKNYLALPFPPADGTTAKPNGKTVLIWGGSSSVGCNAIQLAKAAGLTVYTTCSPHNFDYVKSLGADKAFPHTGPTVIDDIAAELDKTECAGIYMAAGKVAQTCQVSAKSKQNLFVSSTNPIFPGDCPEGVEAKFAVAEDFGPDAQKPILPATFGGYMVEALKKGRYQVAPKPQVVPTKGVEGIQVALDEWKKGISAVKLIVEA